MTIPDLDAALYSKLTGHSALTALVSTRISYGWVKAGEALPYVFYYEASTVYPSDHNEQTGNTVYRVEVVADTRAASVAIVQAIYDALHLQTLTISGWSNWWTVIESKQQLSDNINGVEYHRTVLNVRVRYDKE